MSRVQKDFYADSSLRNLADKSLKDLLGNDEITNDQIDGYMMLCNIFQTCDGGAYTSYATTRDLDNKFIYRNAPSFDKSCRNGLRIALDSFLKNNSKKIA